MRRAGSFLGKLALALSLSAGLVSTAAAQGVTTSSVIATVRDAGGAPVGEARVTAVHVPSGTTYGNSTRADGRVTLPGMRIGGPYRVTVVAIGYQPVTREDVFLVLGVATDLTFRMQQQAVALEEITVTALGETVFSSERTGAATTVSQAAIQNLPSVSGRIADFTRMVPQVRGSSFGGVDNRLNNITVDGSYFNNSFGLGGQPGDRTGVAPISMDAIEQLQVNIAPYDVRQGNFVGAGVNTVTKSGTNELRGSLYYGWRNEGLVGTMAGANEFNPGTFSYNKFGATISGPIIKNRLFIFASYEDDGLTEPGTTFRANTGGETPGGSITRVLASDLDALSTYLQSNFDYATGPYQGYDHETPAKRFLGKVDFNIDQRNKLSVRYNLLDSKTDVLQSNSSSLGRLGNRRTNQNSLNFQNSNYQILENIRSVVGELNSVIGTNKANNLIIGYTKNDESRDTRGGAFFPLVDIEEGGVTYTSFGFEPFTPNNELRYSSFQLQNNFTIYGEKHDWTFGGSFERYKSENVFFPGSQSVYVYNSLADFYTDANDYLANPGRTTSPVSLRRFQVRWSNIPGLEKPVQPLEVTYAGLYVQDEYRASDALKLTFGMRIDVPFFGETGFVNPQANGLTFLDAEGSNVQYRTEKLPDANLLYSPRIGFNWDAKGDRTTQIRGGTGIFTGRPAYVWISNQIGENGLLTGFESIDNTLNRPFNPNPDTYKPTEVAGTPATSYGLAVTDPNFKFPQIWRTNIAIDHRLPWNLVGTAEFLYSRDVNGVNYFNANLPQSTNNFAGVDDRPRWLPNANRIHSNVTGNFVMNNQNDGYAWNAGASLERNFENGFFAKVAYNYGVSKNTIDPGSIAGGSWQNNPVSGDPNNPGVGYSLNSPGHRFFLTGSYRREWFSFGATTLTFFYQKQTIGNASYTYGGDLNGDSNSNNDLLYIPRDKSEMNFQTYTLNASGSSPAVTFTAEEQADAWEAYIAQDDYLSQHRGEYAVRGATFMPMFSNLDLSLSQDLFTDIGGRRNRLQFRVDILNFANLLNSDWGVGQRFVSTQPVQTASPVTDSQGRAFHRLRNINRELIKPQTFEPTSGINDVYRIQFSLRYTFN